MVPFRARRSRGVRPLVNGRGLLFSRACLAGGGEGDEVERASLLIASVLRTAESRAAMEVSSRLVRPDTRPADVLFAPVTRRHLRRVP